MPWKVTSKLKIKLEKCQQQGSKECYPLRLHIDFILVYLPRVSEKEIK